MNTPKLAIVSEEATHVAFVNGGTFTREAILRAVHTHQDIVEILYRIQHLAAMSGDRIMENARQRIHDLATEGILKAEGKHVP